MGTLPEQFQRVFHELVQNYFFLLSFCTKKLFQPSYVCFVLFLIGVATIYPSNIHIITDRFSIWT